MTGLARHLIARIEGSGPITIGEFMAESLGHPEHGDYATRDPLGAAGDFVTAPEVSQMFGELIGLWLAQCWLDRGAPDPFRLVELGPGRGTLLADPIRAATTVPGFGDAADIHLVETSPVLRKLQSAAVPAPAAHHDTLATVPGGPLFLIANEFFDALPVRQFQREGPAWREIVVGATDGALALGLADPTAPDFLAERLKDTSDGDIVEHSETTVAIAGDIGRRLADHGGVALIVDYGDWHSLGATLQAVKQHEPVDPLSGPGTADLTCHVDFETIAHAAGPARFSRLTPQGVFLERLGITERANALATGRGADTFASVSAAHRRLTHPDEMGTLFKAMALYRQNDPLPPGFQT